MAKVTAALVSAALGVGALFGYVASVTSTRGALHGTAQTAVTCPTEDSCDVDYDGTHDAWVFYRTTP